LSLAWWIVPFRPLVAAMKEGLDNRWESVSDSLRVIPRRNQRPAQVEKETQRNERGEMSEEKWERKREKETERRERERRVCSQNNNEQLTSISICWMRRRTAATSSSSWSHLPRLPRERRMKLRKGEQRDRVWVRREEQSSDTSHNKKVETRQRKEERGRERGREREREGERGRECVCYQHRKRTAVGSLIQTETTKNITTEATLLSQKARDHHRHRTDRLITALRSPILPQ